MSEIRSQATPARGELERSAIGWQQYISRALGCNPGQLTYQLEECIEKIEALKPRTVNSATDLDALDPNAVCSFIDSNGITYACTAAEWQMDGFFSTAKPFPTITVHTRARST